MTVIKPIRIGVIQEMTEAPPAKGDLEYWLRLVADEYIASGRINRPVEFISAYGLGLPTGTAATVLRLYRELVEQEVLLVVGPAIGDNALAVTPLVEQLQVPAINWAGAERARGEWMFHLQVGSHEDESLVMARHLAERGLSRIAVVYDKSPIGRRHLQFMMDEAELLGLTLAAARGIAPTATDAEEAVADLLASRPDAIVYFGFGMSSVAVARALVAGGWTGPRVMNTGGMWGYQPGYGKQLEGWHYLDMYSDSNRTLQALQKRLNLPIEKATGAAKGYDLAVLVAEGIARAPELTPAGLRDGLELVKWIPAAEGEEGTLLGFGKQDRGALHGRYLVMRQWRDERSVECPRVTETSAGG